MNRDQPQHEQLHQAQADQPRADRPDVRAPVLRHCQGGSHQCDAAQPDQPPPVRAGRAQPVDRCDGRVEADRRDRRERVGRCRRRGGDHQTKHVGLRQRDRSCHLTDDDPVQVPDEGLEVTLDRRVGQNGRELGLDGRGVDTSGLARDRGRRSLRLGRQGGRRGRSPLGQHRLDPLGEEGADRGIGQNRVSDALCAFGVEHGARGVPTGEREAGHEHPEAQQPGSLPHRHLASPSCCDRSSGSDRSGSSRTPRWVGCVWDEGFLVMDADPPEYDSGADRDARRRAYEEAARQPCAGPPEPGGAIDVVGVRASRSCPHRLAS